MDRHEGGGKGTRSTRIFLNSPVLRRLLLLSAYNPQRARTQNITVGVSFGARRELAFLRATPQEDGGKVRLYFPQTNNGVFSFGRDVNILWKHGVNALAVEEQDGKG